MPWWQIARVISVCVMVVIIIWPFFEIQAMESCVVFYKGKSATIAWDPPSSGVVDHYIIEVTTTRVKDGPENAVTWVEHYSSADNQYAIITNDGYNYSFRVKAVGPIGNESPYSSETLTVICDCSSPNLSMTPIDPDHTVRQRTLELTGTFSDPNIATLEINGVSALMDFSTGAWKVSITLKDGKNSIVIEARDYAGNIYRKEFEIWQQPMILRSEPDNGDIYVMGTPAYPGIFVWHSPLKIYQVIDPSLRIPLTVVKEGFISSNQVISFPDNQDTVIIPMKSFKRSSGFSVYAVTTLENYYGHCMLYPFPADYDEDNQMDIMLSTAEGHVFVLKSHSDSYDAPWEISPLEFVFNGFPSQTVDIAGQIFLIDYDSDLGYEFVAPVADDGRLHLFEAVSGKWAGSGENIVNLSDAYANSHNFGFLDWNNDHLMDIFIKQEGRNSVNILINQGDNPSPVYPESGTVHVLQGLDTRAYVSVCDWNCDGKPDFLGQDEAGNLCVWTNSSGNNKGLLEKVILPVNAAQLGASIVNAAAVDWNGDGIYDMVAGTDTGDLFLLIGE